MPLLLQPFALVDKIWSLLLISAVLGVVMLWAFSRLSNQKAIKQTRNRLKAALMEMRLFGDEPSLLFRAQRDLLTGNGRLLALTLKPALILMLPLILLAAFLEPFYGHAPLPVGEAAVVTLRMKAPIDGKTPPPKLESPAGMVVETPAVRAIASREMSWRIRPEREVDGKLRVVLPGEVIEKSITAGSTAPMRPTGGDLRGSSGFGIRASPSCRAHRLTGWKFDILPQKSAGSGLKCTGWCG